ncbi:MULTISPECIES: hypothetical protein [Bacillus amyloliquefaciens group]|uniref:hypothetical protein n=1 Tax=Bacillus amyloliquefaciens group TaxID=1938374 RepID=UPI002DBC88E1|nr:hypothetical protein [Bacillus velezensis]MEC1906153.1 hypothetical protein [Bacillus velezensis]
MDKYAVFYDYCDPFILFFDTEEEASKEFENRIEEDDEDSGIGVYMAKVIKVHNEKDEDE